MSFATHKEHVIRHEVGHWVVAKLLGFQVGEIKIHIKQNHLGIYHEAHSHIDLHPVLKSLNDVEQFLLSRVSILWAGVMFQTESDKRKIEDILATDGVSDNNKLRELCYIIRGIRFPDDTSQENELEQIQSIYDECWGNAALIHNENEDAINALVGEINNKVINSNHPYIFTPETLESWFQLEVEP